MAENNPTRATLLFFTVASTVREICAAKSRNSAQRCENPKWLNHPASATVRNAVKMSAKTLS
jgi:hypothetical protein